jgi:hypothetical protein
VAQPVGTENNLIERTCNSENTLLVRAINDGELKQLLRDDFFFHFNRGTQYETNYGFNVKLFSKERSGTVIVYPIQKKDDLKSIFNFDSEWIYCEKNFDAFVEIYNVKGLKLEE